MQPPRRQIECALVRIGEARPRRDDQLGPAGTAARDGGSPPAGNHRRERSIRDPRQVNRRCQAPLADHERAIRQGQDGFELGVRHLRGQHQRRRAGLPNGYDRLHQGESVGQDHGHRRVRLRSLRMAPSGQLIGASGNFASGQRHRPDCHSRSAGLLGGEVIQDLAYRTRRHSDYCIIAFAEQSSSTKSKAARATGRFGWASS